MSKAFHNFVNYYKRNSVNNFAVYSDYIIYDELYLDFWDYPKQSIYQNFKYFFKHYLRKSAYAELIALFHFKYSHFTKIDVYKDNTLHHFTNPYREKSRVISYPVDNDYNFFLTITYRNPFDADDDIMKIIAYNDYLNEAIKKGFKRFRDYIRRHYYLELKKEFYNMSVDILEAFFGYIPDTKTLNKYLNQEASKKTRDTFKYFRVYETHKSNVIHCHALVKIPDFLCQLDFKHLISMIASWFETEFNGIELDRIMKNDKKGSSSVKSYILKYMHKQFKADNLVYVDKSEQERVYLLKTSAFVLNFIPRIISYSRGTVVKKYRPFSEYHSESIKPVERVYRECMLIESEIERVNYEDYKLIVDRFITVYEKKGNIREKLLRIDKSVAILKSYLEDNLLLATRLNDIIRAIDYLRDNDKYYTLSQLATLKLNSDLNDVVDF
jgi:hypothetical protein